MAAGAFVQRDMSGALFRNDRRTQDNHPNHTGTCMIDGKEYRVSAWVKTSGAGNKFFSMAFTPKDPPTEGGQAASPPATYEDFDDDIPF